MKKQTKIVYPCWKVQYYDSSTLSWRTIPKNYTSIKLAEAVAVRLPLPKVRLMQIEKDSQTILPEIKK
ncbi:MAG: hypothetical protein A2252_02495 [Elusimicrobia bacterium RIFOXYA2_FULL_39_19]|nr:MAG: hypothetical protein A2252_02495 [Elusimicrobia bacterium RIFOXYA2_FULL_39_19]